MAENTQYLFVGADQSMFTQKVRAYMNHYSIPFQDVVSNGPAFKSIILPHTPYTVIPNLMIVDRTTKKFKVIQDSKSIIQYLQQTHSLPKVVGNKRVFTDLFLEMAIDDWFFLHIMNWRYFPKPAFSPVNYLFWIEGADGIRFKHPSQRKYLEYSFGDASLPYPIATKIGAKVVGMMGNRIPALGLTEKNAGVFSEQLTEFMEVLTKHLEVYQFLMGNEVTSADFSLYGMLAAGLLRDPVPYEWIASQYPVVHAYAQRVGGANIRWGSKNTVEVQVKGDTVIGIQGTMGRNRGGQEVEKGDMIPATTTDVARVLLRDYMGVLGPCVKATVAYVERKGGDSVVVPRGFKDKFTFQMQGRDGVVTDERVVTTHCVWMLQRIIDSVYHTTQRRELDEWLKEVGCLDGWKEAVGMWEGSGWRMDLTDKGTVATRLRNSSKL